VRARHNGQPFRINHRTRGAQTAANWKRQGNQYAAKSECEHCGGIVRDERWGITSDPAVQYAYQVVLDPEKLPDRSADPACAGGGLG